MPVEPLRIGLAGVGTVGGGVVALLDANADQPAVEAVRQLMFLEKVQSGIGDSLAALENA